MKNTYVKTLEEAQILWEKRDVGRAQDFSNQKINHWTILYRAIDSKRPMWVGQCDCGNFGKLRAGQWSQQCEECQHKKAQKDYEGQRFHKLVVLNERENRNGKTYLKCLCDCGNETWVSNGNLTSGEVKSCGCLNSKTIRKYGENFIGMKFNHLTVIEKGECGTHGLLWKCRCDCGNECFATAYQLENGQKQSCNCLPSESWKDKREQNEDLTGMIFNDLTVIDFAGSKNGSRYWTCKCKCGNIKDISTRDLKRESVKSCGCRKYLQINPGDKFGKLTVINKVIDKYGSNGCILYNCSCECGTESHLVESSYLVNGSIKSCGCGRNFSYEEENINKILQQMEIPFIRQYADNILNTQHPTHGRPMEYDFYVNNQYIIEYDGSQHFYYRGTGWDTKEHFEKTRKNDLIKNKYCFENNIPLIRIPYDVDYTIDDLKLETTRFLLTPENEEEYYNRS